MVFVTGGTGLLGSHLLVELSKTDQPIRAIYRSEDKLNLVQKIFEFYLGKDWMSSYQKIEWQKGSILDIPFLLDAIKGCSYVYHCAGLVSFNKKDYDLLMKVNREGTANIVNVSLVSNIKKLCHVSSTAAIGGGDGELINEKTKWKAGPSTSGYSISKYSAEKEVWRGIEEGLNAVIVNPCVIFGAGDWNQSSLTIFKTVNRKLKYYPPGSNATVDARDVATIMIRLTLSDISAQRYLCIGSNQNFKELMTEIAFQLNTKPPSILAKRYQVNIVRKLIGFLSIITGRRPSITKETVESLFSRQQYDNSKVIQELEFDFTDLREMVRNSIAGRIN